MSKSARFAVEFDTVAKPQEHVESDSQSDVFVETANAVQSDEAEERFEAGPTGAPKLSDKIDFIHHSSAAEEI
jgi:hypothetical protein